MSKPSICKSNGKNLPCIDVNHISENACRYFGLSCMYMQFEVVRCSRVSLSWCTNFIRCPFNFQLQHFKWAKKAKTYTHTCYTFPQRMENIYTTTAKATKLYDWRHTKKIKWNHRKKHSIVIGLGNERIGFEHETLHEF